METIKFRAWYKPRKRMFWVKTITMTSKGAFAYFLTDGESSYDANPEEVEIMQLIDRLDKNNKEIYEEDILRLTCGCCFYKVKYQKGKAAFVPVSDGQSQVHDKDLNVWDCIVEVIGNTYENPELWEEK
jgi:uncharacterized phage protein (TIGR01671 family)